MKSTNAPTASAKRKRTATLEGSNCTTKKKDVRDHRGNIAAENLSGSNPVVVKGWQKEVILDDSSDVFEEELPDEPSDNDEEESDDSEDEEEKMMRTCRYCMEEYDDLEGGDCIHHHRKQARISSIPTAV
jgi:TATA-binding protein-associated factor Taf7